MSSSRQAMLCRLYAWLLRACPPSLARHREDMLRLFEDELAARGRQAAVPDAGLALRVFIGAALDVARSLPRAWWEWLLRAPVPHAGEPPAHGASLLDRLSSDLRYALRVLRRQPGFAASAVAVIALAVGAGSALFSVADRALLRPLPYPEPDRLMAIWETRQAEGALHVPASPGNFLDLRAASGSFEALSAWQDGSGRSTLRGKGGALVVETVKVTPAFFRVLGTPALLGRTFGEQERGAGFDPSDRFSGGDRVLVVGHALWSSHFGRDPALVGRTIVLDGVPWRVVGVMPADFAMPRPTTQLFLPWDVRASFAGFEGGPPHDLRFLNLLGRLRRGVARATAEAELQAVYAGLAAAHPKANAGFSVRVASLGEELTGRARPALLLLSIALALVLLLGCANLAGLQLARASVRRREMAVRAALGASRRALVRQLLVESLLLAAVGGAAGLVVASACLQLMLAAAPADIPGLRDAALDGRVLAFAASLALLTATLFGLAPALVATRVPTLAALGEGGHATATPRVRRAWRLLVVGEAAAALVLLTGAGLLGRSLLRVLAVDPGFDARGLVTLRVSLDHAAYTAGEPSRAFYRELMRRLAALPGVSHAAAVTALPLSPVGTDFSRPWWREGEPDPGVLAARADIRMATPGYFESLGMTLRSGRGLTPEDDERAPRVIVVSRTLARRAFGEADPLGRRLILDYLGGAYPYEIVGVVDDVRFRGPRTAPRPELYIPHAQNPYLDLTLVVRGASDASELARRVQREIRAIDPGQASYAVATMEELVRRSSAEDRFASTLVALLAALALVLTATGTHGLLAFLVAQRTRELSLRQALGATPRQVGALVLGESLRLLGTGCALGLALCALLGPVLKGRLFETHATDPLVWAAALLIVVALDVGASALPAFAASRLDPLRALRAE